MSKKPPSRPGIEFEVGARLEAQDCLQKWYPSRIEKIDFEEGKMLVHFERWSHRYDEWIFWDSSRLQPLERPALRKEGLKDEEELFDFKPGEEVLARWTDCRYYPAKIEAMSPEGTYTVQFYDGVIRCLKRMHIKSMPDDARGQDWIALVKAAAAAVALKGKAGGKPRTSANSNKDKEEKKCLKVSLLKEESNVSKTLAEVMKKEEQPTSSGIMDMPNMDVPKIILTPSETPITLKRTSNEGSSFQAKRARLNKITGLLASKAVVVEDTVRKDGDHVPPIAGQLTSANPQSHKNNKADTPSSGSPPKATLLPTALSKRKIRSRKAKYESRVSLVSKEPSPVPPQPLVQTQEHLRVPPLPPPVINETSTPLPMNLSRSSGRSHRRRRSRRLATSLLPDDSLETKPSLSSGKELFSNPPSRRELSVAEAPQVSPLYMPCLPLDLSRGSDVQAPLVPVFHNEYLCAEKEDVRIVCPKAVTDGSIISTTVMNSKRIECVTSAKEPLVDLDHNKFKCSMPACSKAFRKAKLLDYHVKYYHNPDKKTESEAISPETLMRTRATSATVPTSTLEHQEVKRQRTVSSSSSPLSQLPALRLELPLSNNLKLPKVNKKKRSSASVSSEGTESSFPIPVKDKSVENVQEKMSKKVIEKDKHSEVGKKKDKERKEKKEKDHIKSKQKKKKKKKKKSKQHEHPECEQNSLDILERCPSPLSQSLGSALPLRNMFTVKNATYQFPRAIISVDLSGENLSDVEFLDNSSTESLLLSGDEYNQDFDSTNFEESQDEEEAINEIVRCICEMDEEKGFMIQCEECLCWQHSICMGLIEDSIPEQYLCYICREPPGQRWSAKYRFDKDWLNNGRMCGLSFLNENYSHLNAKKIVSTHHLLADVYGVTQTLHGLQLRIEILKNKQHPDLHLWAHLPKRKETDQFTHGVEKASTLQDTSMLPGRMPHALNNKEAPCLSQKMEENYITSEHSYQKPQSFSHDRTSIKGQMSSEDDTSSLDDDDQRIRSTDGNCSKYSRKECVGELTAVEKNLFVLSEKREASEQVDSRLQWQLNLLTHVENVQSEITNRMDLIEKEVDVLESWLDFTGELEPPDPLARLPQLKRRIKQLLSDMGKIQQIATLCTV
ncbi:PHD finger protein 20-like protein 1 isoform X2 [Ambystoma mexicanum]|uniref:PHD finger protein 20-like protein 1 isoform X2 n=1 Tax=Ambystoma mexicanum TaxID=8296 RepID=UPI0037E8CB6E